MNETQIDPVENALRDRLANTYRTLAAASAQKTISQAHENNYGIAYDKLALSGYAPRLRQKYRG